MDPDSRNALISGQPPRPQAPGQPLWTQDPSLPLHTSSRPVPLGPGTSPDPVDPGSRPILVDLGIRLAPTDSGPGLVHPGFILVKSSKTQKKIIRVSSPHWFHKTARGAICSTLRNQSYLLAPSQNPAGLQDRSHNTKYITILALNDNFNCFHLIRLDFLKAYYIHFYVPKT